MKYFSYDDETGFDLHDTADAAKAAAEASIDAYRDEAGEGWPEAVDNICWGQVIEHTEAGPSEPAPAGSELDYVCDYRLVPIDKPAS